MEPHPTLALYIQVKTTNTKLSVAVTLSRNGCRRIKSQPHVVHTLHTRFSGSVFRTAPCTYRKSALFPLHRRGINRSKMFWIKRDQCYRAVDTFAGTCTTDPQRKKWSEQSSSVCLEPSEIAATPAPLRLYHTLITTLTNTKARPTHSFYWLTV